MFANAILLQNSPEATRKKSKDLTVTCNRVQATKSLWRELAQAPFEAALVRGCFSKDARRLTQADRIHK